MVSDNGPAGRGCVTKERKVVEEKGKERSKSRKEVLHPLSLCVGKTGVNVAGFFRKIEKTSHVKRKRKETNHGNGLGVNGGDKDWEGEKKRDPAAGLGQRKEQLGEQPCCTAKTPTQRSC